MFKDSENHSFGFICLFRSVRKNWIWQDPVRFQWWCDLLMEVNHADSKVIIGNVVLDCNRGESLKSLHTWATRWRADVSTVRRFLLLLEKDGMITYKSEGKTTRITICNYESYQGERINEPAKQPSGERRKKAAHEPVLMQVVFSDKDKIDFENFQERISKEFPNVAAMKQPFTIAQYLKLRTKLSEQIIIDLVEDMDLWSKLHTRTSAYDTFRTFYKKSKHSQPEITNTQQAKKKMVI
jgi:hypothetical protein